MSLLKLTSTFLHGTNPLTLTTKPTTTTHSPTPSTLPVIRAMKSMQGKVVCSTNDKTVAVEVTKLAPHPKYKRRVRKKKTYQAHDESNEFKVGDFVVLQKSRPISKNKHFVAVAVPPRNSKNKELGIPVESKS